MDFSPLRTCLWGSILGAWKSRSCRRNSRPLLRLAWGHGEIGTEIMEIHGHRDRCEKFIRREEVDRPLLGFMWEPAVRPIPGYLDRVDLTRPLEPEDISPEEMGTASDETVRQVEGIRQDGFFAAQACFGHQWLEGIFGARIQASGETIWAEAAGMSLDQLARGNFSEENPWFAQLAHCHEALIAHAAGRYPVAVPVLHGPLDLLVALLDAETVALATYDQPDLLLEAMDRLTDLWCAVASRLSGLLPPFAGGYLSRMHIWTPQPGATVQDDATWMMSPENYQRFVQPFERRMSRAVPNAVYHAHNTSTHLLPQIAELDLSAIQVTIDPNGPDWDTQREILRIVQQTRPVLLTCWDIEDAERARRDLDPAGLALTVVVRMDEEEGPGLSVDQYSGWYEEVCGTL